MDGGERDAIIPLSIGVRPDASQSACSRRILAGRSGPGGNPGQFCRSTATFSVGGEVSTPLTLTAADLQALGLASQTVDVTFQAAGEEEYHSFTGVLLIDLLNHAGVPAGPDERNPLLKYYVVVTANDGYQAVFSGGELDPNFGAAPIIVAWEQDGTSLAAEDGPVRIAAPGDVRGGRYVFGVVSIDLYSVAAAPVATPAA